MILELIVTVIRYQNLPLEEAPVARIGEAGGNIGRNPDNDLVLADPDRWVERQHAKISFRDGAFFLTDTSKNGTFVNNGEEPLRAGREVELHDGDELGIGTYEVRVSIKVGQPQSAEPFDPVASGKTELGPLAQPPSGGPTPDILDLITEAPAGPEPSPRQREEQKAPAQRDERLPSESAGGMRLKLRIEPEAPASPTKPDHILDEDAFFRPPEAIPEDYDIWADESHPRAGGGDVAVSEPETQEVLTAPGAPLFEKPQPPSPAFPETDPKSPQKRTAEHRVEFSVFIPTRIVPGDLFILDVWAYLAADYASVRLWAEEVGRESMVGHRSGVKLLSGSILTINVRLPGLTIANPIDNIVWDGEPTNASFAVAVPTEQKPGPLLGQVIVQADGLTIARVLFTLQIGVEEGREYVDGSTRRVSIKSAFASYAGEDRAEVLARIQGMKKVVPDLDVFVDVFSLRSGDKWEQKLKDAVPTRDRFYLFWSKRASESVSVEREWRLALRHRGLDYIDPVPLQEPSLAPPPAELTALHFADAYVSYIRYLQMSRALVNTRAPWKALLEGAGISSAQIPTNGTDRMLREAGALLLGLSGVVRDSVLAMSYLRNTLSLPSPQISSSGNNPFDFSADKEQLVELLIPPGKRGWMNGREAISAVSLDLRAHNAGLFAGFRAAAIALMDALDPQDIHKRMEEAGTLSALFPPLNSSRCWQTYRDRYAVIRKEVEKKDGVLWSRFAAAYEEKRDEVVRDET